MGAVLTSTDFFFLLVPTDYMLPSVSTMLVVSSMFRFTWLMSIRQDNLSAALRNGKREVILILQMFSQF